MHFALKKLDLEFALRAAALNSNFSYYLFLEWFFPAQNLRIDRMSMNSCDLAWYGIPFDVCDCATFPFRAAVDNLIKITAAENGCRYSHAFTAYNNVSLVTASSRCIFFVSFVGTTVKHFLNKKLNATGISSLVLCV